MGKKKEVNKKVTYTTVVVSLLIFLALIVGCTRILYTEPSEKNQVKQDVNEISESQKIAIANKTLYDAGYKIVVVEKVTNNRGAEIAYVAMVSVGKTETEITTQLASAIGVLNALWPNVDYYMIGMGEDTTICTFTIESSKVNKFNRGEISWSELWSSIEPECKDL